MTRLLWTLGVLVSSACGSTTEDPPFVPPNGPIDWTPGVAVGVPGGIPDDRTPCSTPECQAVIDADATFRDGSTDAAPLLQAAISSAPAETFVRIPAGTWRIDGTLNIAHDDDAITIRGDGMNSTVLDCRAGTCVHMGSASDYQWSFPPTDNEITAGLTQGSTELTIADTTPFEIGQMVRIMLENDRALPVMSVGDAYEFLRGQITRVTAKTATTLTVFPPVYANGGELLGKVTRASQQTEFSGIEALTIDSSNGSTTFGIWYEQTYASWVKDVRVRFSSNYSVFLMNSLQAEVRGSFLDELNHGGSNGAGLLVNTVSAALVEDNIIIESFPNIEVNFASSGNVFAYNFINNNDGLIGIDTNHGPHNSFNLYEGNVAHNLMSDGYFGSASDDYLFRNWFHGGGAGLPGAVPTYCLALKRFTRNYVLTGNLIGGPAQAQPCVSYGQPNIGNGSWEGEVQPSAGVFWADWTPADGTTLRGTLTERTDDMTGTIALSSGTLRVGQAPFLFTEDMNYTTVQVVAIDGSNVSVSSAAYQTILPPLGTALRIGAGPGGYQELDLDVEATSTKRSNYYFAGGAIPAEEVSADALPSSMYLPGKPAWFGDLVWPPFDPADPGSVAHQIPAQRRFLSSPP